MNSRLVIAHGATPAAVAFAQAPSGNISSPPMSGVSGGLYDLTGLVTNINEEFLGNGRTPETNTIKQEVTIAQSASGALAGAGDTTVTLDTPSDFNGNPNIFNFPAAYTVTGRVKSSGSNATLSVAVVVKASDVDLGDGVGRNVREAITYQITINRAAGTMSGRKVGTASASGGGSIRLASKSFPEEQAPAPVDWHLDLADLTTTGAKVTGTATAVFANSRSFPFAVKGNYSASKGTRLTLTGTDAGKGAKLTVYLTGNSITRIAGTLLGQKLDISFPVPG